PAAFELRVILDADPGQHGDLGASQTLDPPVGTRGQTDLFRGDPVAPRGQEFADLRSIVHDSHGNRSRAAQGAPRSTTIDRGSPFSAVSGRIDTTQNHPSEDRKSTRLNSSHVSISYAVFCLKKKSEQ